MRLADFIEASTEPILAEWVAFAATCGPAGQSMNLTALQDHALAMLRVIVADLRTPQTDAEQTAKSKGDAPVARGGAETPAETHGAGRAESGFTVAEMVSEYRALRASVLRLWTTAHGTLTGDDLQDLMRFNETIDQAIAESLERYTADIDRSKEMFVAILGHDLRNPLSAVMTATKFLLESGILVEPQLTMMTRSMRSANRMNRMISDLLDFTRAQLGAGVPIKRVDVDLAATVRHAVEEMGVVSPERVVQCTTTGDLQGKWDAPRIGQVLSNLVGNAVQHSAAGTPISVSAQGEAAEVVIRVHSDGAAIPASKVPDLFSPFKRLKSGEAATNDSTNLGLGLYIVDRIVHAHGGSIDVRSSNEAGTLFTVRLPR